MKKIKYVLALFVGLIMVMPVMAVSPYTVDGDLSDWGVTPFTDWVCDSSTCDMVEEDYNGTNPEPGYPPTPYGGELYDIEAAYFDDYYDVDVGGWAYFAIVLSHPPEPNAYSTETGDIAIDLDNNPMTGEYGFEYGIKVQGSNKGQVCYMPDWHETTPGGILVNSPGIMTCDGPSSVVKGYADVEYVNAGIKDYPAGCTSGVGCLDNYIIEVGVKKLYLGLPEMGNISDLHMTQSCGNDLIEINDFDWDWPAPEFVMGGVAVAVLLITPAFAYLLYKRRH